MSGPVRVEANETWKDRIREAKERAEIWHIHWPQYRVAWKWTQQMLSECSLCEKECGDV